MTAVAKTSVNNFRRFWDWLRNEFRKPSGHVGFWCYFVVVVLLVGGLGVWISAARDRTFVSVVGSLLTFFPAIAAASCFELIHADQQQPEPKFARHVAILSVAILGVAAVLITANEAGWFSCVVGIGASVFALALWWLANANNLKLRDDDPAAASGGSAHAKPAGAQGDYGL